MHQAGYERPGQLQEEPTRQRLGAAGALDDPARVAIVAIELEAFALARVVGDEPHVRRRFRPPQIGFDAKALRQVLNAHRHVRAEVGYTDALPAAIAAFVSQPGAELIQRAADHGDNGLRAAVL